ncbi:hypothetical protein B0A48_15034 [Cryoendolithus antarcticus]|uniref:Uncharacterized protein n=1 Tax=Cryoendolithus antarcticus TaxID=1507870 RepID=A0A1V8SJ63_9PEZI|nr:hypothetical protein B0A48_15034 [Cryoendolithus antarcticus]
MQKEMKARETLAELANRESQLARNEAATKKEKQAVRQREAELARKEAEVTRREAGTDEDATEISRNEAELINREAVVLKQKAELTRKAAEAAQKAELLIRTQAKLTEDQAELTRRSEVVNAGMLLTAEQLQSLRTAQKEVRDLKTAHDAALAVHDTEIADLESRLRLYREERGGTVERYEAAKETLVAEVQREKEAVMEVVMEQ